MVVLFIGTYNKTNETPNPGFSFQNTAFVIGNVFDRWWIYTDGHVLTGGFMMAQQHCKMSPPLLLLGMAHSLLLCLWNFNASGTWYRISNNTDASSGESSYASTAMGLQLAIGGDIQQLSGLVQSKWFCFNCYGCKNNSKWDSSIAMGIKTQASGFFQLLWVMEHKQVGYGSTAMGLGTTASGETASTIYG